MRSKFLTLLVLLLLNACSKNNGSSCTPVTSSPAGVSTAPSMTFYVGLTTDSTGTAVTSSGQMSGYFASGGCGPFGIWEGSNGGEVATEIEMRLNTRLGVFAMADGVVAVIQASTSPFESGEVEGVWVRYGQSYVIKYVHVKDPVVSVGQAITSGQRIGSTIAMSNGQFFWETELRQKSGSTIYAKPWNSLLTNATVFNSLYGSGNCTPGGSILGTDGVTATTASNWVNNALSPAQWDVTAADQACSF